MFKAGYAYSTWQKCPACSLDVEVWTTPGKRTILMEPMPGLHSLAIRHLETCRPVASPKPQRAPVAPLEDQGIKMYGVTDKNMMACGWRDGTLEIAFSYGRYQYSNVPENIFVTLRKNPYPNNYFTKVVKNHPELYPYKKLDSEKSAIDKR